MSMEGGADGRWHGFRGKIWNRTGFSSPGGQGYDINYHNTVTIAISIGRAMIRSSVALCPLIVLLLAGAAIGADERLGAKECEDLGFTGLALCSDCNTLAEYVKDEELVSDCRKCCSEDSDDSISKVTFSGAILEVCMRKLVFYPEVVSFIEEEKDKFPYVKIQYAYGSPPKLIMLDSDNNHKETIRIDNWKREHIQQFLREKVKPSGASAI